MSTNFNKSRALSWSSISSFQFSKKDWYNRYILNIQDPPSKEMLLGKRIGSKLEKDPTYLPEIPRHSVMEYPFKVEYQGIPLVGYADSFCDKTYRKLLEFKTGKKAWDAERVASHDQLTMYCWLNFLINGVPPEEVDITLVWLPTEERGDFDVHLIEPVKPQFFKTKRTTDQILKFADFVEQIYQEMQVYTQKQLDAS